MQKANKILSIKKEDQFKNWFEKAYAEYFERLYLYAFSITKQKPLAEDVVSEVFLTIWNKHPNHEDISDLKAYLYVSVKHLAIRLASKDPGKFTYSNYDEALQISDTVDPEKLLISTELKGVVADVISQLSPQSAIIYDLVKNKGLTHKQIAKELDIAEKTVSNQMNLILNRLRDGIDDYLGGQYRTLLRISRIISLLILSASIPNLI